MDICIGGSYSEHGSDAGAFESFAFSIRGDESHEKVNNVHMRKFKYNFFSLDFGCFVL